MHLIHEIDFFKYEVDQITNAEKTKYDVIFFRKFYELKLPRRWTGVGGGGVKHGGWQQIDRKWSFILIGRACTYFFCCESLSIRNDSKRLFSLNVMKQKFKFYMNHISNLFIHI